MRRTLAKVYFEPTRSSSFVDLSCFKMLAKDIDGGFSRFFYFPPFFLQVISSFSKSSAKRVAIVYKN
jgi:hypothetical protein